MATSDSIFKIPLTKDRVALIDITDSDLAQFRWHVVLRGKIPYVYRHKMSNRRLQRFALHRVIMGRVLERPLLKSERVDHINRNTMDNRRANLRLATASQNMMNRAMSPRNKSGFKGVTRGKYAWIATCCSQHIGCYDTAEDAAIAYNHKALELQGEFAVFNEVPNWRSIVPIKRADVKGRWKNGGTIRKNTTH